MQDGLSSGVTSLIERVEEYYTTREEMGVPTVAPVPTDTGDAGGVDGGTADGDTGEGDGGGGGRATTADGVAGDDGGLTDPGEPAANMARTVLFCVCSTTHTSFRCARMGTSTPSYWAAYHSS